MYLFVLLILFKRNDIHRLGNVLRFNVEHKSDPIQSVQCILQIVSETLVILPLIRLREQTQSHCAETITVQCIELV